MSKYKCDNCGCDTLRCELEDIPDLNQRLDVGGVVPAGECAECGSFSYEVEEEEEEPLSEFITFFKRKPNEKPPREIVLLCAGYLMAMAKGKRQVLNNEDRAFLLESSKILCELVP
jgi:hypothetical protein